MIPNDETTDKSASYCLRYPQFHCHVLYLKSFHKRCYLQAGKQAADFFNGKLGFQAAFRPFRPSAEAADVGDAAEVGVLDAQFAGEDGFGHSGHAQYVHTVAAVTLDFGAGRPARALQAAVNGLGV